MFHECLNKFRNREKWRLWGKFQGKPRAQKHHLSGAYSRWFQIPQPCGEMEEPLRHVPGTQRKDAWVDLAFLWLFLYGANRPRNSTFCPCLWSCLLQFTPSPPVRPETTLIIEVRNARWERNCEIILCISGLIFVFVANSLTPNLSVYLRQLLFLWSGPSFLTIFLQ